MLKVNLEQLKYSSGLQGRTLYLVLSTPPPPPRPPCLRSAEGVVPGDLWHSGAAVSGARRESQISREADEERPRPRIRRSVHFHSHLNTGATARTGSRLRYFLSFQDLVTRSAATAAARGPARSAASRARAFSSSSRTTQGWRNHTHTHNPNGAVRAVSPDPSVRQSVRVRVPQGVLGRPAPLQKMLRLLRALQREPQRPVHLLSGRPSPGGGRQHVHGRLRGRLLPGPR